MEKVVTAFILIWALVLWAVMIYIWRLAYREWRSNRANRLSSYTAKVLDKRITTLGNNTAEYTVMFEFGKYQREFTVDEDSYNTARVGCEGILHLRGERFEAFEPITDAERAEELFRRITKK
jgi:ABC-type multidrug transport system fused ATPase/permease subunit